MSNKKSNLSIKSNLNFTFKYTNLRAYSEKEPFESSVFVQKLIQKNESRKIQHNIYRKFPFKENSIKGYSSNQKSELRKHPNTQIRDASVSNFDLQNHQRSRKLVCIKTIENFGGIANFKLKKPSMKSSGFGRKKNSVVKTRDKSYQKRKYRDKKIESSSSEDIIPGSSSAKARAHPRIWFENKNRQYYSKKSQLFSNFEIASDSGFRERQVIRMYLDGKKIDKRVNMTNPGNPHIKSIRQNVHKIIQESKSKGVSRTKGNRYHKKTGPNNIKMSCKLKNNIQTPSIISIDPLYIHAFLKRKRKKQKLKKSVAFFMATFKSRRTEKKFFIFEDEKKVIKFPRRQKNKIIEHTVDDDYDTDNEQLKLAVQQCKLDFKTALKKALIQVKKKKRSLSMMNLVSKRNTYMNDKVLKLQKLNEKSKRHYESPHNSRRQTRKNLLTGFRKDESVVSMASTVASSLRNTHKPKKSKERGRKMIKNEFYKADKKRRAISNLPKRGSQKADFYSYFEKGYRKRNKMGF